MAVAVKICGLTDPPQAAAVAACGVTAIGVIAVAVSPRCVPPRTSWQIWATVAAQAPRTERVLVVADAADAMLDGYLAAPQASGRPTVLQLHGREDQQRCSTIAARYNLPVWKAHRVRTPQELAAALARNDNAAARLLDAHDPQQLGGTGQRLPLEWFRSMARQDRPWWLAGGLGPENVAAALKELASFGVRPHGVDASSRLETAPGCKDLDRCRAFVNAVARADGNRD